MKTINKVLCVLTCLIIIIGVVIWKTNGFNFELQYSTRNQITLSNNTGINRQDVEIIVSEVLGNTRFFVQDVETFGNVVSIVADELTEEQKKQIVEKYNEKNGTKIETDSIRIVAIPFTRVKDVIKPFIIPGVVTSVVVLIYFLIRFKSLGWKTILAKTVIIPLLAELLLYSFIVITRIPFGRITVSCGIALYIAIVAILTNKFENQREKRLTEIQDN